MTLSHLLFVERLPPSQQFVQVKRGEVHQRSFCELTPPCTPSHRSEGIITSRWAITSLLILAVTSEVCPKAGWPNGTLVHPRHPPVSPTQQTVIDFCKLSYHDDSLLFCWLSIYPIVVITGSAFDFNWVFCYLLLRI